MLNMSAALALWGYRNLRCDWSAGICAPSESPRPGSLETSMRALLEPRNSRAASDAALPDALAELFGDESGPSRLERCDAVRAQCFVVAKENLGGGRRKNALLVGNSCSTEVIIRRRVTIEFYLLFLKLRLRVPTNQGSAGVDLERLNNMACLPPPMPRAATAAVCTGVVILKDAKVVVVTDNREYHPSRNSNFLMTGR